MKQKPVGYRKASSKLSSLREATKAKKPPANVVGDKSKVTESRHAETKNSKNPIKSHQKNRKHHLLKARALRIVIKKFGLKRSRRDTTPFQRSPGPPPTSSIVPPPSFIMTKPYELRPRTIRESLS